MMQSALAKERREQKMLNREQEVEQAPGNHAKTWIDPMPDSMLIFSLMTCVYYYIKQVLSFITEVG